MLIPSGGAYRSQQNKIENLALKRVIYTPPIAPQIGPLMGNWESFVNQSENEIDPLIRCAIAHYQFESIHPFTDGNGRTGRILMVLQLVQDKILRLPLLYISGFINQNRTKYYQLLHGITAESDWNSFILFMLEAFYSQAKETKEMLLKVMNLYESFRFEIKEQHSKIYSADLIQQLFSFPVVTPVSLGSKLNIHYTTASRYLHALVKSGHVQSSKIGKYHFFINHRLMQILS